MTAEGKAARGQPEFEGLTSFERPKAERRYQRWQAHFDKQEPGNADANRQRALNLAYIGMAQLWLAIGGPVGFIAAGFWSFHNAAWQDAVAGVLSLICLCCGVMIVLRWRQARRFWGGVVRP